MLEFGLLYPRKGVGRKFSSGGGAMERQKPRNITNKLPAILSVVC